MKILPLVLLIVLSDILIGCSTKKSSPAESKAIQRVTYLPGDTAGIYKASYALVVGISNYTNGWPTLENVESETHEVVLVLREHGFDVDIAIDPNAKRLESAFDGFFKKYGYDYNNRLLVFFSGHGYTRDGDRKAYLVPSDAPRPDSVTNEMNLIRMAFSMERIASWAREVEAKHALFVFDSCFSGAIFKVKGDLPTPLHIAISAHKPVRQFITAGSADEVVPARSVFTPVFVSALKGKGDLDHDGFITGTELGYYVRKETMEHNNFQTPQFGKIMEPSLREGDFIFEINNMKEDCASASACLELGYKYSLGRNGAGKNAEKAIFYYERACSMGSATACTNLGHKYRDQFLHAEAISLYSQGCEGGSWAGCVSLGNRYLYGEGVPQDKKIAADYFSNGCEEGIAVGCCNLGKLHRDGEGGLVRNDDIAFVLYERACHGGSARCCNNLGFLYESGYGTQRDAVKAAQYYRRACNQGEILGCENLSDICDQIANLDCS